MNKVVFCIISLLVLSCGVSKLTVAQGICVISEKKVTDIRGLILLPNKIPIPEAEISLLKKNNNRSIIATIKSDLNGRFRFSNIKSGRYFVEVSYPTLVTLLIPIRVASSKKEQYDLIVTLNGIVDKPCGRGRVDLQVLELNMPDRKSQ